MSGIKELVKEETCQQSRNTPLPQKEKRQNRIVHDSSLDYLYQSKFINAIEAVGKIKSGDSILYFGAAAEPEVFLEHLHLIKNKSVHDVNLMTFLPARTYDFFNNPDYKGILNLESMFFSKFCRDIQRNQLISYAPCHLRNSGSDWFYYHEQKNKPIGIYCIAASPMDKHGYLNTSTTAMFNRAMVKKADMVIVEINESLPRTFGDSYIHISEVDYIIQGKNEILCLPKREIIDVDKRIGQYIAELIEDGSTIQLGIGSITNAVAAELRCKRNLGVHTEMLNDALVDLYKVGAIDNTRKTVFPNKMVTTFTYGSKETYDFIDDNIGVLHLDVETVNDPYVIAKNKKMVSINTTLQVDLMGQCASEAIGTLQLSGAGGQVDTAMGAKMSEDGKSIVALHSTAMVKNKDGNRIRRSTIVPIHPGGTVVTLSRADVDYVVTEYGVAALRGASLRERAKSLIRIAHPDFRDELVEEAERYSLV